MPVKTRKLNSVLAGEASAKFSLLVGLPAVFDCRLSLLPNENLLIDYFYWRAADAHRNALNAHCYWILRKDSFNERQATAKLEGLSVAEKNELLFSYNINFNDLPAWQKTWLWFFIGANLKNKVLIRKQTKKPLPKDGNLWMI